ncbi:hypothetical protein BGZ80_002051 [Entomortierella chlamydospora]|uniref:Uncharacterized protein n=1 Tax=Entomortierella chlamydospora TaxID=101097 RepID=A0A9P6MQ67_9FUNG|nr:hypothetical protein BGZ80_002051 [Entomortierella chlamydospora]
MSSARHAKRILRHVNQCKRQVSTLSSIASASRRIVTQSRHKHQIRQFSLSRYTSSSNSTKEPASGSDVIEKPPTTVQPPKFEFESLTPPLNIQESENMTSIEQVIAELNRDASITQPSTYSPESETALSSSQALDPSLTPDSTHATNGPYPPLPPGSESTARSGPEAGGRPKTKPSRFWFYLYHILYWSALGSLPVHLLLLKGDTKDTKERQEWKIGVLTEMRDKLKRGESVDEEEALLSVGMERSKREEQVDDKYFEDQKLDYVFGKDKDGEAASDQNIPASAPAPAPAPVPAPPVVPRKPAPPKSEKSYL